MSENNQRDKNDIYSKGYATIGKIDFPPIIEQNTYQLGECILKVYDYDYDVPHFHIESVDGKFNIAVSLLEGKYYSHNGRYITKLTGAQCHQLYSYLNTKYGKCTVWEKLVTFWNNLNPDHEIPYEELMNFKDEDDPDYISIPAYDCMNQFIDTYISNHYDEPYIKCGIIDFSDHSIKEHCLSFNIRDVGECTISVMSDYGHSVPYFYLNTNNVDLDMKKVNTSICIYSNEYLQAPSYGADHLTDIQKEILDTWLRSKNDKLLGNITNWEHIVNMWESLNPDCTYPEEKKVKTQPDYKRMEKDYGTEKE